MHGYWGDTPQNTSVYLRYHTIGPNLLSQVPILTKAASEQPGGDWWIKADSCDLSTGLMESVHGKWGGDVDLNDGKISELLQSYQQKKDICQSLGLQEPRSIRNVRS